MLPNIKPMIRIDMVFLILLMATSTANNTKKEPVLAAPTIFQCVKESPPKNEVPSMRSATPKLAPALIPKTKGPAKGFRNSVCMSKPLTPRPLPTSRAVNAFGSL